MAESMNVIAGTDPLAAAAVWYACTQTLAQARSNPVLMLLPAGTPPLEGQHYPTPPLAFTGEYLRAYYHSHPREHRFAGEHGHFHIFIKMTDKSDWVHLAGLCMDPHGQPLRWFMTNHWVTAGAWVAADMLIEQLGHTWSAIDPLRLNLVERWLWSMLGMFGETVTGLLLQRDSELIRATNGRGVEEVMADRTIYILAEQEIDLLSRVEKLLANA
jgi:hypothetical protein